FERFAVLRGRRWLRRRRPLLRASPTLCVGSALVFEVVAKRLLQRPEAFVGWRCGEAGRPIRVHGVRVLGRAVVREMSGLLGVRDADRGDRRPGGALEGAAEAVAAA